MTNPLSPLVWKLLGGLAVALLVGGLVLSLRATSAKLDAAEATVAADCAAARSAIGDPKLDCKQTATQVGLLGQALRDVTAASEKQTAAIKQLAAFTRTQQEQARQAVQQARQRTEGIERTRDALQQSIARPGAPCEPSAALKGAWQ